MKSSPPGGSRSQPFTSDPSTANRREICSIDEILAGCQHQQPRSSTIERKRQPSVSSELSDEQRDDPVGDLITKMLNDGKVPHFGYSRTKPSSPHAVDDSFQLYPLFSSKNFRLICKFFLALWNRDHHSCKTLREQLLVKRECQTMRFILESFAVIYITIYSMNDIILRSVSEFVLVAMLWTITTFLFNVEEVKDASCSFIRSYVPPLSFVLIERFSSLAWEVLDFVERTLLWGNRFHGRTLLWSDETTLFKFRKEHNRLLTLFNELKQNRGERRKTRKEKRRREKRGEAFTKLDIEKMMAEKNAKERLKTAIAELAQRPTTLFRKKIDFLDGITMRHNATERHMESLQFCQKMTSLAQEKQDMKPVLIQMASYVNGDSAAAHSLALSSKDTIEVVDLVPDIYLADDFNEQNNRSDESLSLDLSEIYTYDSSSSENDEDDSSAMTTTSNSTARSMPWMIVGAKIGHKLLSSHQLQRVIANPNAAQNLIPEEAKKLLDGIKEARSQESQPSPSKSKSFDDTNIDKMSEKESLKLYELSKIKQPVQMKPPVHGMRTSAGSTAKTQHERLTVTTETVSRETVIPVTVKRLSPIEKGSLAEVVSPNPIG